MLDVGQVMGSLPVKYSTKHVKHNDAGTSAAHFEQNLQAIARRPLEEEVRKVTDNTEVGGGVRKDLRISSLKSERKSKRAADLWFDAASRLFGQDLN